MQPPLTAYLSCPPVKDSWLPLLRANAALHEASMHPPSPPLSLPWHEIGPGYHNRAFGHWDLIHSCLDILPDCPEVAAWQLHNLIALQQDNGLLPAMVYMSRTPPSWDSEGACPPLWWVLADEIMDGMRQREADTSPLLEQCYAVGRRQLGWWLAQRKASDGGILDSGLRGDRRWDNGIDDGIRFDLPLPQDGACVDLSSQVCALARAVVRWAETLGQANDEEAATAERLSSLIREQLWCPTEGFFHDGHAMKDPSLRRGALENCWPVALGIADAHQANTIIDQHLLEPRRFFTAHPLSSVAVDDPRFELRMWRGPAWNSITWWMARGCAHYGRWDAVSLILERALDVSADIHKQTGEIWEFYHPHGGDPRSVARKPYANQPHPWPRYQGHNPLHAMARLWLTASNHTNKRQ